jgi:serine/tyrosine/threonine adenylyltransferase
MTQPPYEHTKPRTTQAALGPDFFDAVAPADFPEATLRYRNNRWAGRVGLDRLSDAQWVEHFARFAPLPGSFPEPLALRYHGHQFGAYNPDLGDGRGFLFAQFEDLADGRLLDLGTKGSGKTPWSRGGDGRLTLKGGVREILATAMLEALGVDTSKTFSLIETGEALYRGDEPSPTRSAVLVRLSHSHIRIGTFQRLDYLSDSKAIAALVEHAIAHYFPTLTDLPPDQRVPAFLGEVAARVARTGARIIAAGFVHGVLNSDNINITGESFDYGPWRFLPAYDPGFTAAYFDEGGRYAFGRQPDALAFNLTRLAECLVPLAPVEKLESELNRFWPSFQSELALAVVERLGLEPQTKEQNAAFLSAFYGFMGNTHPVYEQTFFDLRGGVEPERLSQSPNAPAYANPAFNDLKGAFSGFDVIPEARTHSYFSTPHPTTMLIDQVEALWAPIADMDEWAPLRAHLSAIETMGSAYGTLTAI